MSLVVSETSPRALLDSALELSSTLNLLSDDDLHDRADRPSASRRGPGFVLKEVERVLVQICKDLDLPVSDNDDSSATKDPAVPNVPLMMRLRMHIDSISTVLTGNKVDYADAETTTLYELIESLSLLNKSVCTTERRSALGCVIF